MTSLPQFNYQVIGPETAPVLTFIPGIGNDLHFWEKHAQLMSSNFRVITFDPWGHNHSPLPPESCSFFRILEGVIQLWNHLGVEQSDVVGLGFGGSVSLALGLYFPERVKRIVACCCRPRQPDNRHAFWRQRLDIARRDGLKDLGEITVDRWLSSEFRQTHPKVDQQLRDMIHRTTVEGYCAYVEAFIEMDFSQQLGQIKQPTLLLAAEHDHGGGPVEDMQAMAARMPNAEIAVIQGSGHICNFEAPEQVSQYLTQFLNQPSLDAALLV
ncbi:3-oxoadipate enol-lactonase [Acinetobacter bohemicus ANC 3994]|uniref:3-oxoadipate enol-lactonase n=1 Tax=Acinetobacter bohemicus ANC 3994 TaxID=1217715 RepID=N8QC16_9GAMM|nr:alpha/beta fold hydrolase [Acinetobacter bohemicus]ENU18819.1 3-oxoadipate enol-lactonase [Acinetobacter bohemicus ANC 3994]